VNPLEADCAYVTNRLGTLLDEFRNQRIFITGGTGFFGCWLLECISFANRTLGLNIETVVLTRDPEAFEKKCPHLAGDPAILLHKGNIVDFNFPPGEFSHVIHAATDSVRPHRDPVFLETFDTIVTGTRRVLEFSRRAGVKKLLLTSSGAVYGKQPPDLETIPEEYNGAPDPTSPGSVYGEGKRAAELLCSRYAEQCGFEAKLRAVLPLSGPTCRSPPILQ
jgi:dTDP-glucose 4,6-dehydratase